MRLLLWTLLVMCLAELGSGARILAFFPFSATSHHILFEPWIRGLCERGHQVTYLSPYQFKGDVPNLEKIPFSDFWPPIQTRVYESQKNTTTTAFSTTVDLYDAMIQLGNASLRCQEVKDVLQSNRQYDAVITEAWFSHEYTSVLFHRFNALPIIVQTFGGHAWTNEMSGLPNNPSWMYDVRYFKGEHPANFFERLYSLYITAVGLSVPYWFTQTRSQSLVDQLVRYPGWENRPRLTMLASDVALVLRNTHFSLGYPAPTAPHVRDVGGLNVDFDSDNKPQELLREANRTPERQHSRRSQYLASTRPRLCYTLFLLAGVCWECSSAARILVFFPLPWKSHQFVVRPLVKELAKRGHHVHFITSFPMTDPPKGVAQHAVKDWQQEFFASLDENEISDSSIFGMQRLSSKCGSMIMAHSFAKDQASIELLKSNETYDAVITEFPMGSEGATYLAHKFQAVSIAIMGLPDYPWLNEMAGLPDNPSYMINYLHSAMGKLSFLQRLYNTYVVTSITLSSYRELFTTQQKFADDIIRYEGWENRPKLTEMISETALILTNSHPSTGLPYPRAPHVKEIAGMNIDPEPLPKELQDFMDDAPHGVIYFSLGSVLDPKELLANGKFETFLNVFRRLNQKVMWKVAPGMPEVKDPNIKLQTWYPQQGILAHKNVKLFITHGGLQSTVESIAYGVPTLGMPFFFDQMKDVAFMTHIGMGLELSFDNISESTVSWSINELLNNPKYRENARKRQGLFHDRPMRPVDEAAYWIEYVLRHGKVLRPASATMPFYQLYLLDVAAFVLMAIIVLLYTVKALVRTLLSLCRKSSEKNTKNRKKNN